VIRPATPEDAPALRAIDHDGWSYLHSPVPRPPLEKPFETDLVLVDEREGEIAGYIKRGDIWPLDSVTHVRDIKGLAVAPAFQRQGVGRALLEHVIAEARADGARKVTLRVLGHNTPAQALYKALGFVEEGNLRGLFLLDGTYVDDVLMALNLTADGSSAST
jgi:ribosomal protein S18 acetylase RimI-like enzyme